MPPLEAAGTPCGFASPTGTSTGRSRGRTRREPPRLQPGARRSAGCSASATGSGRRRRTRDFTTDEARAGEADVAVHAALRRRQERGRGGDPGRAGGDVRQLAGGARRGPRGLHRTGCAGRKRDLRGRVSGQSSHRRERTSARDGRRARAVVHARRRRHLAPFRPAAAGRTRAARGVRGSADEAFPKTGTKATARRPPACSDSARRCTASHRTPASTTRITASFAATGGSRIHARRTTTASTTFRAAAGRRSASRTRTCRTRRRRTGTSPSFFFFFLHVSSGRPTLGCVALPLSNVLTILRWLRPERKPLIAIGTAEQLART